MVHLTHSTKTISEKNITRIWHEVDVSGKRLGRIANTISSYLQGKHKPSYVPNIDIGDYVVVTNAKKIVLTGKKADVKTYSMYSGYPGGMRKVAFKTMLDKQPQEVVRRAVSGMLPKNNLRDKRLARLFVYPDVEHPHKEKVKNIK